MPDFQVPITAIILTNRNDSKFVRALSSAQWAKEVIVVDNNSGNDWKQLKEKYSFTLQKWPEHFSDFSEVRNQAMAETKFDWILFLDSDEWVDEDFGREVQQVIDDKTAYFLVNRQDFFLGKPLWFGEARQYLPRLVHKGKGKWVGKVHETWQAFRTVKVMSTLRSNIYHEPHDSLEQFISKINFYSSLRAEEVKIDKPVTEAMLWPVGKFLINYFVKAGVLDGVRGFCYALMMSLHSAAVRIKYYEKQIK